MKTTAVTELWEFYRDNCTGYKEPMRKKLHELDDSVAELEAENEALRELVRDMALFIALAGLDLRFRSHGKRELSASAFNRRMNKLGVKI